MSIRIMTEVWAHSQQRGTGLIVLLAIADWADDEGYAYPSIRKLAEKARASKRSVQYTIRTLVETGELEVWYGKGRNGTNLYRIRAAEMGMQSLHPSDSEPVAIEPGAPDSMPPVQADAHPRVHDDACPPVQTDAPKPSVEPSLRTVKEPLYCATPDETGADVSACDETDEPIDEEGTDMADPRQKALAPELTPPEPEPEPRKPRKKDPFWEAMVRAMGHEPTIPARGMWNKAIAAIKRETNDPREIPKRASVYREKWPQMTLTPIALAKHWYEMAKLEPKRDEAVESLDAAFREFDQQWGFDRTPGYGPVIDVSYRNGD